MSPSQKPLEMANGQGKIVKGNLEEWSIEGSIRSLSVKNPIRVITDQLRPNPLNGKPIIQLAQGDPTSFGHLLAPPIISQSISESAEGNLFNGYLPSTGLLKTREAIARNYSSKLDYKLNPENDVMITVGCGGALQLCFESLLNEGSNILLPRPGFPFYESLCQYIGLETRFYDLEPENNWQIDLEHVSQLVDKNTIAILICNPGNPSGAVFSQNHLEEIVSAANNLRVPIISDEVYEGITFRGCPFFSIAKMSKNVPVFTCCSLSKRYLVPGWRMGWVLIVDRDNILIPGKVREAFISRMQMSSTPCSVVQAATVRIIEETPKEFFSIINQSLELSSDICFQRANSISGIQCPSQPQGSMFLMIKIICSDFEGIENDVEWCGKLLHEESVALVPGTACKLPGWARVVFSVPLPLLDEAWDRIEFFCYRHLKKK